MNARLRLIPIALVAIATLTTAACSGGTQTNAGASNSASRPGLLAITAGSCTAGSSFRMVQPGGTPARGPYVQNGDSPCADKTVTPLAPGSDGGLRVGAYQPQPDPAFGPGGGSRSAAVIRPAPFFAVPFGISTNPTDPQTRRRVSAPTFTVSGTTARANLSALSVSWNGQYFNQGDPKPGSPGTATGTFDAATGRYRLDWTSTIQGGPFNGFIGVWHLEGTFHAS